MMCGVNYWDVGAHASMHWHKIVPYASPDLALNMLVCVDGMDDTVMLAEAFFDRVSLFITLANIQSLCSGLCNFT